MQDNRPLYLTWIIAMSAMAGSLYFSEVLKLAPCVLCWWQRILIYPLVIIMPIGISNMDKKLHRYVLPLSITGIAVASYHYLLTMKIIPESLAPCQAGVSCAENVISWFGFINIPLLSLASFVLITLSMIYYSKIQTNE
ncbi:MAG: disulfide bond formation protein B [bacterium]|nr:disulfide bond formation protein B [bacterium]